MLQNKEKHWILDEESNFNQTNDDFHILTLKNVLLTTNYGEVTLENFDNDKVEQLITAISSSGLEIQLQLFVGEDEDLVGEDQELFGEDEEEDEEWTYMSSHRFLLAVKSRDIPQADKSIFNFLTIKFTVIPKLYIPSTLNN